MQLYIHGLIRGPIDKETVAALAMIDGRRKKDKEAEKLEVKRKNSESRNTSDKPKRACAQEEVVDSVNGATQVNIKVAQEKVVQVKVAQEKVVPTKIQKADNKVR